MFGGTWQENIGKGNTIVASGYTNDALLGSLSGASTFNVNNSFNQYRYVGIFGRINYNWMDKYILNLSARRDGSSRFGPGKQFANFGAIGTAWIFSNENFIKRAFHFLSYGKLRGSYGTAGNDIIGDYQYLDSWVGSSSSIYQNIGGVVPARLFNPDYSWEVNKKLEAAIELGFMNDRILLTTAFYRNRCGNQLVNYSLPLQTGFSSVLQNFPALVENSGYEFEIKTKNLISKDFKWTSTINFSIPRNKLVSFPDLKTSSYGTTYVEGQSLQVIYKYQYQGVDPATGIFQFNDVNEDNKLDINDYTVLGNLDPKFYGGIQNSFSLKGFNLDIFFEFRKQMGRNYFSSLASGFPYTIFGLAKNQPVLVLDRWQKAGDQVNIQKFASQFSSPAVAALSQYFINSNGIYSDASFIRLKNISISYNLPTMWLTSLHISNVQVYLHAQNLLTITSYVGSDPENQNFYQLPPLKTLVAGIQLNF